MNCLNIDDNFKDQLMRFCQTKSISYQIMSVSVKKMVILPQRSV